MDDVAAKPPLRREGDPRLGCCTVAGFRTLVDECVRRGHIDRVRRLAFVPLLAIFALVAPASRAEKKPKPAPVPAKCVAWHTEVRARAYGYDHFVVLTSSCTKSATCVVSTDVNPAPQTAEVAAGETVEVATFLGSPASSFTATVDCTLKP